MVIGKSHRIEHIIHDAQSHGQFAGRVKPAGGLHTDTAGRTDWADRILSKHRIIGQPGAGGSTFIHRLAHPLFPGPVYTRSVQRIPVTAPVRVQAAGATEPLPSPGIQRKPGVSSLFNGRQTGVLSPGVQQTVVPGIMHIQPNLQRAGVIAHLHIRRSAQPADATEPLPDPGIQRKPGVFALPGSRQTGVLSTGVQQAEATEQLPSPGIQRRPGVSSLLNSRQTGVLSTGMQQVVVPGITHIQPGLQRSAVAGAVPILHSVQQAEAAEQLPSPGIQRRQGVFALLNSRQTGVLSTGMQQAVVPGITHIQPSLQRSAVAGAVPILHSVQQAEAAEQLSSPGIQRRPGVFALPGSRQTGVLSAGVQQAAVPGHIHPGVQRSAVIASPRIQQSVEQAGATEPLPSPGIQRRLGMFALPGSRQTGVFSVGVQHTAVPGHIHPGVQRSAIIASPRIQQSVEQAGTTEQLPSPGIQRRLGVFALPGKQQTISSALSTGVQRQAGTTPAYIQTNAEAPAVVVPLRIQPGMQEAGATGTLQGPGIQRKPGVFSLQGNQQTLLPGAEQPAAAAPLRIQPGLQQASALQSPGILRKAGVNNLRNNRQTAGSAFLPGVQRLAGIASLQMRQGVQQSSMAGTLQNFRHTPGGFNLHNNRQAMGSMFLPGLHNNQQTTDSAFLPGAGQAAGVLHSPGLLRKMAAVINTQRPGTGHYTVLPGRLYRESITMLRSVTHPSIMQQQQADPGSSPVQQLPVAHRERGYAQDAAALHPAETGNLLKAAGTTYQGFTNLNLNKIITRQKKEPAVPGTSPGAPGSPGAGPSALQQTLAGGGGAGGMISQLASQFNLSQDFFKGITIPSLNQLPGMSAIGNALPNIDEMAEKVFRIMKDKIETAKERRGVQ